MSPWELHDDFTGGTARPEWWIEEDRVVLRNEFVELAFDAATGVRHEQSIEVETDKETPMRTANYRTKADAGGTCGILLLMSFALVSLVETRDPGCTGRGHEGGGHRIARWKLAILATRGGDTKGDAIGLPDGASRSQATRAAPLSTNGVNCVRVTATVKREAKGFTVQSEKSGPDGRQLARMASNRAGRA